LHQTTSNFTFIIMYNVKKIVAQLIFLFLIVLHAINAQAQKNYTGIVYDSTVQAGISKASVLLISAKDSILLAFTRTNNQGEFALPYYPADSVSLLITHPKYVDNSFDLSKHKNGQLGTIPILNRKNVLEKFVVKGRGGIRMRGDTTVYLADSFKVDENASVEDLLKMLPGIQVDKEGKITAQGEQVQKVLVDGDEFFGDDPTIATRNLQAKILDKVEVFDDKSEQAKFTGFDDGQREKTINLKMKDNLNKGVFGKASGATDVGDYYDNSIMLNAFKAKRKLSGYATYSSTGTTGLGWEDNQNFGGSSGDDNMVMEGDGIMYFTNGEDDAGWNGRYNGDGFPKTFNSGINFSNKWQDKYTINLNAGARRMDWNRYDTTKSTQFINETALQNYETERKNNNKWKYNGNAKFDWIIDTTASLNMRLGGSINEGSYTSEKIGINQRNGTTLSQTNRLSDNNAKDTKTNIELTYKKKLKRLGHTISISSRLDNTINNMDGILLGNQNLNGTTINLDQKKYKRNNTDNLNTNIAYTEPLLKNKILLQVSLGIRNRWSNANKVTTIQNGLSNEYNTRVDSLSNNFKSNIQSQIAGVDVNYNGKKINASVGLKVQRSHFLQQDIIRAKNFDYKVNNFLPNASISYSFNRNSRLSLRYNGSTSQPRVDQLQNLYNNEDPLEIQLGNPNLKQSFRNNLNLNFWSYKAFTDRNLYAGASISNTINDIRNVQSFNLATGVTTYQYQNINGYNNMNAWYGWSIKVPKTKFNVGIGGNYNASRMPNVINDVKSYSINQSISFDPNISLKIPKKSYLSASCNFNYSYFTNAVQKNTNAYWSITPELNGFYNITKRLVISSDVNYSFIQKNQNFNTNFNRVLWNGSIEYRMLKAKNLEVGLEATDILNQNVRYNRYSWGNFLTENTNATIRRLILFRATYYFSAGPVNKLSSMIDDEDE
jgi:hypothetical protein